MVAPVSHAFPLQQLELIDEDTRKDPLLTFPVAMEEWLMEGSYNKILSKRHELPTPYYAPFMHKLEGTVR